jgi:hypothetical protein
LISVGKPNIVSTLKPGARLRVESHINQAKNIVNPPEGESPEFNESIREFLKEQMDNKN